MVIQRVIFEKIDRLKKKKILDNSISFIFAVQKSWGKNIYKEKIK